MNIFGNDIFPKMSFPNMDDIMNHNNSNSNFKSEQHFEVIEKNGNKTKRIVLGKKN